MQNKQLTKKELAFLIIAATVTITVVSTCSPLYPLNPWDDVNCFFTLGRGIIHGLVPYRDLYEQKGPLLYFIYALAALVSERSFIGAWIIECIAASVFAIFSWKIAKLFTDPPKFSICLVPLLLGLTYTTRMFNFGGNAEELCFPLLTIALYCALRSIVKGDALPENKDALICGIITGILFWIKYTFIGFIAGFCIYILILCIKRKAFFRLWSLIWRFLTGFIILSVPILLYFIANNSLSYLWEAYFGNIFLYHTGSTETGLAAIPVIKNIYIPLLGTIGLSIKFPLFGSTLLCSLLSLFFIDKKNRKMVVFLTVLTFAFLIITIFTRTLFIYYYPYILACFFSLALIPFIKGLALLEKTFKQNPGFMKGIISAFLFICYAIVLLLGKNTYLFLKPKEAMAQWRYADTIKQTPNAKILTYDIMDSGFYTSAGLLPQNRFYCYLKIETEYPAILEEQHRLIKEGFYDYIITTYFCEEKWENYKLIREETDTYIDYTGEKALDGFRLYKRV